MQDEVLDGDGDAGDAGDEVIDDGLLLHDGLDDLARMDVLGEVAPRRRARDAALAERARTFKQLKRARRERDAKEDQLRQARTHVSEYRPGMFLELTSGDICTNAFTRAYRGARLGPDYQRIQNLMMSLCASGVEHAQNDGLQRELDHALAFTRAGGRVVLGVEHVYDETNQRLSVPPSLMSARLHASRGARAVGDARVKNVSCPLLVSEGLVHFEYVPPGVGSSGVGSTGVGSSAVQESEGLGVRACTTQPWIMRPRVLHGKSASYMMQALSMDSPLHIWSPRFREVWESRLKHGIAVLVDVDNRDDARTNQAYVAMVAGEAERFFAEAGRAAFYIKFSHRCDIHQVVQLSEQCMWSYRAGR